VQFLEALAAVVGGNGSANGDSGEAVKAFVGADAKTGRPVLQLPLPPDDVLARGAAALAAILRRVEKKS
jgi:hypothetical protein